MSLPDNNGFVGISINDSSVSYPPNAKLNCNLCNCNLSLLDTEKEEWIVRVAMYHTSQTKGRKSNGLTVSKPLDRRQLLVKLLKSFEEMQRHGVKITNYTTTEDR